MLPIHLLNNAQSLIDIILNQHAGKLHPHQIWCLQIYYIIKPIPLDQLFVIFFYFILLILWRVRTHRLEYSFRENLEEWLPIKAAVSESIEGHISGVGISEALCNNHSPDIAILISKTMPMDAYDLAKAHILLFGHFWNGYFWKFNEINYKLQKSCLFLT